jgi:hypothetical protein
LHVADKVGLPANQIGLIRSRRVALRTTVTVTSASHRSSKLAGETAWWRAERALIEQILHARSTSAGVAAFDDRLPCPRAASGRI